MEAIAIGLEPIAVNDAIPAVHSASEAPITNIKRTLQAKNGTPGTVCLDCLIKCTEVVDFQGERVQASWLP